MEWDEMREGRDGRDEMGDGGGSEAWLALVAG